ncbi:MAG: SMC-Scp complex subunit ScpB [Planctomycetota bacterium]
MIDKSADDYPDNPQGEQPEGQAPLNPDDTTARLGDERLEEDQPEGPATPPEPTEPEPGPGETVAQPESDRLAEEIDQQPETEAPERPEPLEAPDQEQPGEAGDPDASEQPHGAPEDGQAAGREDGNDTAQLELATTVEAVLFATDTPLSPQKIAQVAEVDGGRREIKQAIQTLNERYEQMGCAFRIERIAGGFQMLTLPEYNDVLSNLLQNKKDSRLSTAAMETLSIIAYRQPILRADIEAVRGVSSGEMVRQLIDKQLVKIVGRAEVLGRPMLYGTTRRFLEVFGLNSLDDLPRVDQLRQPAQAAPGQDKESTESGQSTPEAQQEPPETADQSSETRADAPAPPASETEQPDETPDQQQTETSDES